LTTSPSQKTGIEIPTRPTTITIVSMVAHGRRREHPIAMLAINQIAAAPNTSDSVTGAASVTVESPSLRGLTYDVRSREMEELSSSSGRIARQRLVEPKSFRNCAQGRLIGISSGDARRRVDAGRGEEDQEREDADRRTGRRASRRAAWR